MDSKYLEFNLIANKPKTKVYDVTSKHHGTILGIIKWYFPWRQYCFFPMRGCLFNAGCLSDIMTFLKDLNQKQRNKKNC